MLEHIERLFALDVAAQPAVEHKARLLLLDTLGCMLAGRAAHEVAALEANLTRLDPGAARFPGGNGIARSAFASLAAIAACWDEACEGLASAHGRPGVPVIAACLALANFKPLRHGELLAAIVTGYEIGARAGEALRIRPGMHVDAGWPAIGVAAAAARMLGLSARQALAAIELAACQLPFGLYLPIKAGANGRNTYLGHAASLGLHSALAIEAGIAAPVGAVAEHARLALGLDLAVSRRDDRAWRIVEGYLKPYAAVRHVHYGAAAAASLRQHVPDSRAIRAITLDVYDEALTYCGNHAPQSAIQAQFSLSFGLAAMLRFGRLDPDAYRAPLFDDVELRRLEALIDIRVDSTYAQHRGARVTLHTDAGTHTSSVDAIAGDPAHPLSSMDVRDKFLRYATASLPADVARHLADAVLHAALDRPVDFLREVQ